MRIRCWEFGLLFLLLVPLSCKKDYPNDIPGWVKDRIKRCKEPFHDCHGLSVKEFQGLGATWYYFREESGTDELYTEGASLACNGTDMFVYEEQCAAVVLDSLHQRRTIWVEH
ncbi:MAG: hypothetical protein WAU70_05930 [Flavobacteriales bacterium]